jgi:hypothetical protein
MCEAEDRLLGRKPPRNGVMAENGTATRTRTYDPELQFTLDRTTSVIDVQL